MKKAAFRAQQAERRTRLIGDGAFTFVELLVVLAVVALLTMILAPSFANTQGDTRSFRCVNNQRQIMLAWRIYGEDNNDVLPPNDYPFTTAFSMATPATQYKLRSWVTGTMAQAVDSSDPSILTNQNSVLSAYIKTASVYHCPADVYLDPKSHTVHTRSYSMNAAVGTVWNSSIEMGGISGLHIGAPVQGGWLPGAAYNSSQATFRTYGSFGSMVRPTPAKLFVMMEKNAYSINDGTITFSAASQIGEGYLIDFTSAAHDGAATIAFADGHALIHRWHDATIFNPRYFVQPGGLDWVPPIRDPNDLDLVYLASITSAPR